MKTALEAFWSGKSSEANLMATSNAVDEAAWRSQADAGVQLIALDGTLYDHVADFAVTYLGLVPERFRDLSGLELYFGAARGTPSASALDMSKHFDTNYHSLTPELSADSRPNPNWQPLLDRVRRGQAAVGKSCAVPILVGPLTLTALSRGQFDRDEMVSRLVPAYVQVLESLRELGVPEVQVILNMPFSLSIITFILTYVQERLPRGKGRGYPCEMALCLDRRSCKRTSG